MDTSSSFTRKMNSWATLPAVMAGTVVGVMALQFIFTFTTACPCDLSAVFSGVSFTGPPLLFFLWSGKFLRRLCCSSNVEEKEFNLRGASVLMVAAFTWVVVALLNGELLCCMLEGNRACRDSAYDTYFYCESLSQTSGVILMVIVTVLIFLIFNVCCACATGQSPDQVDEGMPQAEMAAAGPSHIGLQMPRFPNTNWALDVNIADQFDEAEAEY
ncbi:uncharacterized protein LOC144736523 [Lampetra planeri]